MISSRQKETRAIIPYQTQIEDQARYPYRQRFFKSTQYDRSSIFKSYKKTVYSMYHILFLTEDLEKCVSWLDSSLNCLTRDFQHPVFPWISVPRAPECSIGVVPNFLENSRRDSRMKKIRIGPNSGARGKTDSWKKISSWKSRVRLSLNTCADLMKPERVLELKLVIWPRNLCPTRNFSSSLQK